VRANAEEVPPFMACINSGRPKDSTGLMKVAVVGHRPVARRVARMFGEGWFRISLTNSKKAREVGSAKERERKN
jgi:hypothetical protein